MSCCYLVAAALLSGYLSKCAPQGPAKLAIAILPGGLMFPPIVESLVTNQKGTLCLLIVTTAFLLLQVRRPAVAGFCFGWLMFKPQLALPIMLVMLWKRQFAFCLGCLGTLCLLGTISLAVGWDACSQFLRLLGAAPEYIYRHGYSVASSHCVDSFFHGLIPDHPREARMLAVAATVGLVLIALRLVKGPIQSDSRRFALQYSGLIVVTILISPHLYGYDLSLLLLPFVVIIALPRHGQDASMHKAAAYVALALFCLSGLSEYLAQATGVQLTVILMACLLYFLLAITGSMRPDACGSIASQ